MDDLKKAIRDVAWRAFVDGEPIEGAESYRICSDPQEGLTLVLSVREHDDRPPRFLLGALLGDDEPLPTTQASQQGECLPLQSPKTLVVGRGTHEPLGGGNGGPQGRRR